MTTNLVGGKPVLGGEVDLLEPEGDPWRRKGAFSRYAGATSKADDRGWYEGGEESVCRLFVYVPGGRARHKRFLHNIKKAYGTEAEKFAEVSSGTNLADDNNSLSGYLGYVDFFVSGISRSHQEKVQIVPTLSDNFVAYSFGQNPVMIQVQGELLNTRQDEQSVAFDILYQSVLRSTRIADLKTPCYFFMPDRIAVGAITNFSQNIGAQMQSVAQFGFTFLVTKFLVKHNPDRTPTAVMGDPFSTFGVSGSERKFLMGSAGEVTATYTGPTKEAGDVLEMSEEEASRPMTKEEEEFLKHSKTINRYISS